MDPEFNYTQILVICPHSNSIHVQTHLLPTNTPVREIQNIPLKDQRSIQRHTTTIKIDSWKSRCISGTFLNNSVKHVRHQNHKILQYHSQSFPCIRMFSATCRGCLLTCPYMQQSEQSPGTYLYKE